MLGLTFIYTESLGQPGVGGYVRCLLLNLLDVEIIEGSPFLLARRHANKIITSAHPPQHP